jgi:hypothetical protein
VTNFGSLGELMLSEVATILHVDKETGYGKGAAVVPLPKRKWVMYWHFHPSHSIEEGYRRKGCVRVLLAKELPLMKHQGVRLYIQVWIWI